MSLALFGCAISDPGAPEERWELDGEFVTPPSEGLHSCWLVSVGPAGKLALEPTGTVTEQEMAPETSGEIWRNVLSDEKSSWIATNPCASR